MPEVPSAQSSSTEEVKLTNELLPQPSEADLDKAVAPVVEDQASPYKKGDVFYFTAPNGESYSISVVSVDGSTVSIQNSTPGTEPVSLPVTQAQEILESAARVNPGQ